LTRADVNTETPCGEKKKKGHVNYRMEEKSVGSELKALINCHKDY